MLGGPERINAEPAHSHLTVLVVRSGRSISCIGCVEGSGSFYDRRLRDLRRAHAWDRRLAYAILRWRFFYVKTVTHTLELDPGARWSAGRVRVYGTHGPRSQGLTTSLRRTTGTRERCRWPARPPPRTGAQPWRGPGCWAQSPKPKARSEAPMHPSPPNFNAARAGTANEITARFRFSKRKNISLMR